MRAIAAPFATKLAWIFAVLVIALLHEKIECALTVVYALIVHAVFYWLQITIGGHGGVDYRNVSLLDMASSPSNVFQDAMDGDAMAVWVISSLVLIVSYRHFILARAIRMVQVQRLHQSARCSDDSSGFHLAVRRTHLGTV